MTEPVGLILLILAAGVTGWLLGRRQRVSGVRDGVAPHLLPDPALEWLRRAHRALGVWITELDPGEEGAPALADRTPTTEPTRPARTKAPLGAAPAPAVEPVQPVPTAQTHVGQRRRPSAA